MITHAGIRYWTTDELAGSLMARELIAKGGSTYNVHRRVKHWADRMDLRPMATTKRGVYLWPEDAVAELLELAPFGV